MANSYDNYMHARQKQHRPPGRYQQKLNYLKQMIREYVHVIKS